jgi:ribonuclease P protein component
MTSSSATFPKCDRIRRRIEYLSVQGRGRKLHTDNFLVFVLRAPDGPPRFGITVTKKVGGAVVRNRVKRVVREVLRRHKAWFPTASGVVLVAKQGAAGIGFVAAEREIELLCARCFPPR